MNTTLSEQQFKILRRQLRDELHDLEKQIEANENFGLEDSTLGNNELSLYDNHPGDIGTELYERGKDIALNELAEEQLERAKLALQRMEDGTYGTCTECGKPIPFERLEVVPSTVYCIDHAAKYEEQGFERPLEETFLYPGFGRSSTDETEDPAFDGEDAWQIVQSWGTSNTPALSEDRNVDDYNDMAFETEENEGYVEAIESFIATDIYGNQVSIVRNEEYRKYMANREGEPLLEPDWEAEADELRGADDGAY
ncbi:TraR/DksA C4-type zinc finger protein [Paenibacillus turpanensis]|uniref:TraR/DksA C4-type zinc finger protein n=1 Tax=Paenibacillus turpanensis TaxID=2689078 RepID=UPI00140D2D76|nr:TraR/DksA C4-type zinc finger protein [Paenibacillus turpanensis]